MMRLRVARGMVAIPLACVLWLAALSFGAIAQGQHGTLRTYYIAADELDWDYVPSGFDKMMGMPPEGYAKIYTTRGPHQIGKVYRTPPRPPALTTDDQRISVPEQDLRIQLFGETTLHRVIGQSCKDQINLAFVKFRKFHRRLVYRHNMKSYTRMVL